MTPLLLLTGVFGCAMGPSAETLVDELRVLAVLADKPEARPGETVALESLVVDPRRWVRRHGMDVHPGPDGCLEAAGFTGVSWDGLVTAAQPEDPWLESAYFVAPWSRNS